MNTLHTQQKGYILFFSMVLTAIILSLLVGIATTSFRQRIFTQQVKQSTVSFYGADTTLDCLIAQDNRGNFGTDPLGSMPTTVSSDCSGDPGLTSTSAKYYIGPNNSFVYEFNAPINTPDNSGELIRLNNDTYCARARVTKFEDLGPGVIGTLYKNTIDVWGYNMSCDVMDQYYNEIFNNTNPSTTDYLVERSLTYTYEVDQ